MADPVVYRSRVRIERVKGPLRRAYLPARDDAVHFGVHSEVAAHYGVDPHVHTPNATTLDYLVAAAAERAHAVHAERCPVYRTIRGCIETTTSLRMEDLEPGRT